MSHAPPLGPLDEYLLQDPKPWANRVHNVEADIVCVGHSHIQFNLTAERVVAINPGSVGQSRDGDPRATYAILDDNKNELKRVEYPVEETIAPIEASPLPDRVKQSLCLGRLPVPATSPGAEPGAEDVA
jgi:diadenosine tetraphosphatase ApaH/serine/threonine PP2A family protein phosphatase